MTPERAKTILNSYGGRSEQWPVAERTQLQSMLATDAGLQALQQQALMLDQQLDVLFAVKQADELEPLAQRINECLPDKGTRRSGNSFYLRLRSLLNYPENAHIPTLSAMVLAVLIAIGINQYGNGLIDKSVVTPQEDVWSLMAESLDNTSTDLTLFAVLEPELFEDGLEQL